MTAQVQTFGQAVRFASRNADAMRSCFCRLCKKVLNATDTDIQVDRVGYMRDVQNVARHHKEMR